MVVTSKQIYALSPSLQILWSELLLLLLPPLLLMMSLPFASRLTGHSWSCDSVHYNVRCNVLCSAHKESFSTFYLFLSFSMIGVVHVSFYRTKWFSFSPSFVSFGLYCRLHARIQIDKNMSPHNVRFRVETIKTRIHSNFHHKKNGEENATTTKSYDSFGVALYCIVLPHMFVVGSITTNTKLQQKPEKSTFPVLTHAFSRRL